MLNLVLISWNDFPLIVKCVSSVINHVDRVIAVDGIFRDFPHVQGEPGYSTDGTLEYLSSLDIETVLAISPGLSEVEKRNCYLLGEEGDWYLHLDTDEWVEHPEMLKNIPENMDVCFCPTVWTNSFHRYPRLFKHQEGMHYEGLHYRLVDGDGALIADINGAGDYRSCGFPLVIRHDRDLRDKERWRRKNAYYRVLSERESEYKEMLRYG